MRTHCRYMRGTDMKYITVLTIILYLCSTVEAEAGICNTYEKYLVACTILNRVESADFPNTITEVIEQPGQFQVYANKTVLNVEVSNDTYIAVKRAIWCQKRPESLYFCNYEISDTANQGWFDGLTQIYRRMMRYYR